MNKRIYYKHNFIELTVNQTQNNFNLKDVLINFVNQPQNISFGFSDMPGKKDLPDNFYFIEAAGGLIQKNDDFLFIRRHNRWDLPKGKLEKNEHPELAAIRECEEECGISGLTILAPLPFTWHLYEFKGSYALKKTWWYHMHTHFEGRLIPQIEEDITAVQWFKKSELASLVLPDTYHTIKDTVKSLVEI